MTRHQLGKFVVTLGVVGGIVGCGRVGRHADAFGTFEAIDVIVSAESNGKIVSMRADEGKRFDAGDIAVRVDTTGLDLKRQQAKSQLMVVRANVQAATAQMQAAGLQRDNARAERARVQALARGDAATSKQLDEAKLAVALLERQYAASVSQVEAATGQLDAATAVLAELEDQLRRADVRSPVTGTVIAKFVEAGEIVTYGRPLFKIANLERLILRVFVSEAQLTEVRIGGDVTVQFDGVAEAIERRPGTVVWVADEAEFTPKVIQTRDERVHLVYAVKISVDNADGRLKIGMPGEVVFDDL